MVGRPWLWVGAGLVAILFLVANGVLLAQETPAPPTPSGVLEAQATPTIDRLAAPPTVPAPTQADDGAQLYWLWCQPCHGDQGQGLTDEWRAQYPEEDQNCWNRGCHGNVPYEDGFTLPKHVPAVTGSQSLLRFQTMEELFEYIHIKMPYEYPGALSEEEALAVTAYLARAHGKWDGTPLTKDNVVSYRWQPPPTATPQVGASDVRPDSRAIGSATGRGSFTMYAGLAIAAVIGIIILGGFVLWRQRR